MSSDNSARLNLAQMAKRFLSFLEENGFHSEGYLILSPQRKIAVPNTVGDHILIRHPYHLSSRSFMHTIAYESLSSGQLIGFKFIPRVLASSARLKFPEILPGYLYSFDEDQFGNKSQEKNLLPYGFSSAKKELEDLARIS